MYNNFALGRPSWFFPWRFSMAGQSAHVPVLVAVLIITACLIGLYFLAQRVTPASTLNRGNGGTVSGCNGGIIASVSEAFTNALGGSSSSTGVSNGYFSDDLALQFDSDGDSQQYVPKTTGQSYLLQADLYPQTTDATKAINAINAANGTPTYVQPKTINDQMPYLYVPSDWRSPDLQIFHPGPLLPKSSGCACPFNQSSVVQDPLRYKFAMQALCGK